MNKDDFKNLRKKLKMTQAQFGQAMGFAEKSGGRRARGHESGQYPIGGTLAKLMQYVEKFGVLK